MSGLDLLHGSFGRFASKFTYILLYIIPLYSQLVLANACIVQPLA